MNVFSNIYIYCQFNKSYMDVIIISEESYVIQYR